MDLIGLNLKTLTLYLKLSPFDKSTELGRTQERYRLSAWASVANIAASGLAFLVLVFTVPITLPYLGEERFGVWMTVASLVGMLTFLDMGVANGFVSHVARIHASNDRDTFRRTVTRGLLLLVLIGLGVGLLLTTLNFLYPLQKLVSVETLAAKEDVRISAWFFIGIFSFSIPLNGLCRVFDGIQKSWLVHIVRCAGSVVSIVAVILLAKVEAAPYYLLLGTYGIQTLMPLILLVPVYREGWLSSTPHRDWGAAKQEYKHLFSVGGLFLVLQIGTMIGWGADALIVSILAGAAAVAQLAVAQRIFQIVSLPLSIINAPLWAAYADAKAHNDKAFLERTLKKALLWTIVLSGALSALLYFSSGVLLEVWIGDAIHIPTSLLLGFSIWKIMESTGNAFSMFLNGIHVIRPQIISVALFCLLALPPKIYFVPVYGASAAIWSTVFAYTIAVVAFYSMLYRGEIINSLRSVN